MISRITDPLLRGNCHAYRLLVRFQLGHTSIANFSVTRINSHQRPTYFGAARTNAFRMYSPCRTFSTSHCQSDRHDDGSQSEGARLLYVGDVGGMLKFFQGGIYAISLGLLGAAPYLIGQMPDSPVLRCGFLIYIGLFGLVNPALFYKFSQRYVHKLYHDRENDVYTALLTSPIVAGYSKLTFTPHDCTMPKEMTMFTSFLAKGRKLFVNSDAMDYYAYSKMLRHASEFDYENPDRQTEYKDAVQESLKRLNKKSSKPDGES